MSHAASYVDKFSESHLFLLRRLPVESRCAEPYRNKKADTSDRDRQAKNNCAFTDINLDIFVGRIQE